MRVAYCLGLALLASAPVLASPRNPLDALRLEDLSATHARPLFAPSRRPPPPPVVAPEAPETAPGLAKAAPPEPPPFELIGAVVGEGTAFAILRNRGSNQVVRLRPGEEAAGWRVGVVGLRSVSLERDGRTESLALTTVTPAPDTADVPSLQGEEEAVATQPVAELNRVVGRRRPER